ncbi:hypothetical protein Sgleb_62330 [Streptomyces glebosus]|uniref:Uncharacterized protein n=1 Tax=Streptomyces glebosus TaxID=249580 RepID=A0A640T7E3_9ACTN|nr:hypothetical protein Sgleb_62330 [Streptomyces glebosus]
MPVGIHEDESAEPAVDIFDRPRDPVECDPPACAIWKKPLAAGTPPDQRAVAQGTTRPTYPQRHHPAGNGSHPSELIATQRYESKIRQLTCSFAHEKSRSRLRFEGRLANHCIKLLDSV